MFKTAIIILAASSLFFAGTADARSYHHRHVQNAELTSDNYYTNIDGQTIHGPSRTRDGHRPSGATARCQDGTWSFSQHHSGTCSHHGGVSEWL